MSVVKVKLTPSAGLTVVVEKLEMGLVGILDEALLTTCATLLDTHRESTHDGHQTSRVGQLGDLFHCHDHGRVSWHQLCSQSEDLAE